MAATQASPFDLLWQERPRGALFYVRLFGNVAPAIQGSMLSFIWTRLMGDSEALFQLLNRGYHSRAQRSQLLDMTIQLMPLVGQPFDDVAAK
jgi:hypothetical protein